MLFNEVDGSCEALGDENKLIVAPGLLSGTKMSSASRLSIGAKSPLTGGIKESNGGGTAAIALTRLAIQALVIEGDAQSGTDKILVIRNDDVQIVSTEEFLFKGVYDTAQILRNRYGSNVALIIIGPAGERQYTSAGIALTDMDGRPSRFCARGGLGAVMGSKGLKAIVIDPSSTNNITYANKELFTKTSRELTKQLRENPQTGEIYPRYGTPIIVDRANSMYALPSNNFSQGKIDYADQINGEKVFSLIQERGGDGRVTHACMPGCVIRCSNIFPDKNGKELVSPIEYETIGLIGANCGISNIDSIARLNYLCNDLGIDTIEFGAAVAVAMEQKFLNFGDSVAAEKILNEMKNDTVIGKVFGQGALVTGRVFGSKRVPVVKGQAMAAYDPRAIKGFGVTYATSPMGADHTAGVTLRAPVDHTDPEPQPLVSRKAQIASMIADTLGLCLFSLSVLGSELERVSILVSSYTGSKCSADDLTSTAINIIARELEFNRNAGLGSDTDRIPSYMMREPIPGLNSIFDVPDEALDTVHQIT